MNEKNNLEKTDSDGSASVVAANASDANASAASAGKLKSAVRGNGSAASKYFYVTYGSMPRWKAILMEIATFFLGGAPGAFGLFMRSKLYRPFFAEFGKGVVVGRNVTFRHPSKIRLADGVILDDNSVVDAKGGDDSGVSLGKDVYIGRNSIVYCKGGKILMEEGVNISANCVMFSSNSLTLRRGSMIGAYSYFLSGGEYDAASPLPFCEQSGTETKGPLEIGANCWFGARVTVLDGAGSVGERCVVGAGAVVTKAVPPRSLALGVPAKIAKKF